MSVQFAKGPPAKCDAATSLTITFREGIFGTDALRSDRDPAAANPYEEGVDNVGAHLNGPTGNLMLDVSSGSLPAIRSVKVTAASLAFDATGRTFTNNGPTECGLFGLAAGSSGQAVLESEWRPGDGFFYSLRYGKDCSDRVGANQVDVTRSGDGSTWTITGTSGVLCSKPDKGKPGLTELGSGGGFQMTLVKL